MTLTPIKKSAKQDCEAFHDHNDFATSVLSFKSTSVSKPRLMRPLISHKFDRVAAQCITGIQRLPQLSRRSCCRGKIGHADSMRVLAACQDIQVGMLTSKAMRLLC